MKILFGIGSNLGDRDFYLDFAVEKLVNNLDLKDVKRSKIFKNPAMLMPNSPKEWDLEFFNIALSGEVDLEEFLPIKILQIIKDIEKELGRDDKEKWAPRQIDIDILAIGDLKFDLEGGKLKIPHEGLFERDFFYKTVMEIEERWFEELKMKFGITNYQDQYHIF